MTRLTASIPLDTFRRVVLAAPVSYSVYSAFSFYGARRRDELPGTWLVAALGVLGHEVAAIRQTLYRMEASAALTSRAAGRHKFYRLSPGARADAEAGLAKMMEPADEMWDRRWTIVQLAAEREEGAGKELVREVLRAEGFARTGPNLFVHPRNRVARLMRAARAHGVAEQVTIFRGRRVFPASDAAFAASAWDLSEIAGGYRIFLRRYLPIATRSRRLDDLDAFVIRFALVFDFLETGWRDPELPGEMLPRNWPGADAKELVRSLYERLLPQALAFGDRLPAFPAAVRR